MVEADISSRIATPMWSTREGEDKRTFRVEEADSLIVNVTVPWDENQSLGWAASALAKACDDCLVVCPIQQVVEAAVKNKMNFAQLQNEGIERDVTVRPDLNIPHLTLTFHAGGRGIVWTAPGYLHDRVCNE